jgi:hypothetical protein
VPPQTSSPVAFGAQRPDSPVAPQQLLRDDEMEQT